MQFHSMQSRTAQNKDDKPALTRPVNVLWIRHGLSAANAANKGTLNKIRNKGVGMAKRLLGDTTKPVSGYDPFLAETAVNALLEFRSNKTMDDLIQASDVSPPSAVFCSCLYRAIQTALLLFYPSHQVRVINGIGELPLFDPENKPFMVEEQKKRVSEFIEHICSKITDIVVKPDTKTYVNKMFDEYRESEPTVVTEFEAVKKMSNLAEPSVVSNRNPKFKLPPIYPSPQTALIPKTVVAVSHSHYMRHFQSQGHAPVLKNNQVLLKRYTPDRRFGVGCRQEGQKLLCNLKHTSEVEKDYGPIEIFGESNRNYKTNTGRGGGAIDFVWMWCGPKHNKPGDYESKCHCVNDLLYSVRSVCKNAPWFNKLYVVISDGDEVPAYFEAIHKRKKSPGAKLKFVRASEVVPKEFLPTWNSNVIESYVHRIRGLSDEFVYMNDDMYILKPVRPSRFFKGGKPVVRHEAGATRHGSAESDITYVKMWQNAIAAFGLDHTRFQHQAMPYRRDLLRKYFRRYKEPVTESSRNRHRSGRDFNLLRFSTSLMVMGGEATKAVTTEKTDLFVESFDAKAMAALSAKRRGGLPTFLCINNNVEKRRGKVERILERLLSEPCEFENAAEGKC